MDALAVAEAGQHNDEEPQTSNGPEPNSEPENKFQRAISAWRGMHNDVNEFEHVLTQRQQSTFPNSFRSWTALPQKS
jgi:hypothetical protein